MNPVDSKRRNHDPVHVRRTVSQLNQLRRVDAVALFGERDGNACHAHENAVVLNGAQLLLNHTKDAHAKSGRFAWQKR